MVMALPVVKYCEFQAQSAVHDFFGIAPFRSGGVLSGMMRFGRLLIFGTAFLSVQLVLLNGEPACNQAGHVGAAGVHQMAGMDMSESSSDCDHVPAGRSCDQMGACLLVFTLASATDLPRSVPLAVIESGRLPSLMSVLVAPELPPPRA